MSKRHHSIVAVFYLYLASGCAAPPEPASDDGGASSSAVPTVDSLERGLRVNEPGASDGYVLFSPNTGVTTYLVDREGQVVHTWTSDLVSGTVYLLANGNLLRTERVPEPPVFSGDGQNGRIREFSWDGEVLWEYILADEENLLHHDIARLPNGNLLAIAWESKSADESRQAGRREDQIPEAGLWPGVIFELEPVPPDGAKVVWEWHAWDHLVQDTDESLPNYGDPSEHPHRIHINGDVGAPEVSAEELEQLKALGYVPEGTDQEDLSSDLLHLNAVNYNAELDQIAVSTPHFDEIWIVDHSTTTEEAAGSSGGRWGHGGDLLYRWGNPLTYGRAQDTPKQLFGQHDIHWIPAGLPGAGHLMVFNNKLETEDDENYSAVYELVPPVDAAGNYVVPETGPFGPAEPVWSYVAPDKVSFYSSFISGAHRLPNGNTFICSGATGRLLEVTAEGELVWDYWHPYVGEHVSDGLREQPYAVFRATKIPADHPALAGKDLKPLDPQPEILTRPPPAEEEEAESESN